jgi:hypothetical protein
MKIGPIVFHRPKNNLGCAAIKIGNWFYVDSFRSPQLGFYFNIGSRSGWLYPHRFWVKGLPTIVLRGKRRIKKKS